MTKRSLLCSASARAAALGLTVWMGGALLSPALAQQTPANTSAAANQDVGNQVEEVVVTGSLIRGTPEDAALPVDVIGQEELEKQGSPSTLDLIKGLTVSNGVLGDTNQFDSRAQGSEGSGSVNLRGLGANRTLVLINGRRMTINPLAAAGSGIVDTNMIPQAAIGRVEVLKDGAAATYGSDAIGGVVNFITRTGFEGIELGADYKFIDGSSGDYGASILFGMPVTDRGNLLLSVGYQHRGKLRVTDRSYALNDFLENPQGGFSAGGNPGSFVGIPTAVNPAGIFRDPGCAATGQTPGVSGATPVCYGRFIDYDNLIEKEEHLQAFGSFDYDLSDNHRFHIEGLYGKTEVPEWETSPSYLLTVGPTPEAVGALPLGATGVALFGGRYFVPRGNPGLEAFIAQNPTFAGAAAAGLAIPPLVARPLFAGGNPLFNDRGSSIGKRFYEAFRVSGGLNGDLGFGGLAYDVNVGYSEEEGIRTGYDTLVNRFQLALRGFGGENCNRALGVPGQNGCLYFNPFANAISVNTSNGAVNPGFVPAAANSPEVISYFFKELYTKQVASLFTAEAVISGNLGFTLGGGDAKFAVGAQYRKSKFDSEYDPLSDLNVTPCRQSVDFNINTCTDRAGPFVFLAGSAPFSGSQDVNAVFGEIQLPITDSLNVQIAGRYEDYGGAVGDTIDPKISARWQITDWFAVRGSAGTTFRGPAITNLNSGSVTSLQLVGGKFTAVDIFGNPNLSPEKADTYNAGLLFDIGGLRASIDYFRFDFEDQIISEPLVPLVAALFPNGTNVGGNRCADPTFAGVLARFQFNGLACTAATTSANISRVRTQVINGSKIKNDGIDINIDYDFGDLSGGNFSVGGSLTYITNYKVASQAVEGITVAPAFNAVGKLNFGTSVVPIPRYKFVTFAEYERDGHNFRATLNYINGYTDQRTDIFLASAANSGLAITRGKRISNFVTLDLAYRVQLPYDTTFVVSADNVTDTDPPFARLELSYDPFTANPYGRAVKVAVKKVF